MFLPRLYALLRLSRSDLWLVLEAVLWLALARILILIVPFRWLAGALRQQLGTTPEMEDAARLAQLRAVARAIGRASRHTFWQSNCLAKALAGKCMLRRRGIASTLYMGVAKNTQGQLEAHAWLRSGKCVLTGGGDQHRYTIIATFADRFAAATGAPETCVKDRMQR